MTPNFRIFLKKFNHACQLFPPPVQVYISEGQIIETKLLTQGKTKNFFRNNVKVECQKHNINTNKMKIQGTFCKI